MSVNLYPLGVDLRIGQDWVQVPLTDVSAEGVQIRRGRSDEGQQPDPADMQVVVRNDDGRWSPRNPRSPLFGKIGRNTPIRCWVRGGTPRLLQPPGASYATTADSAALSPAGDLDLRVEVTLPSWRPTESVWVGITKAGAYGLYLADDGRLVIGWQDSGQGVWRSIASTEPIPGATTGRKAVRAELDADNGAGRCAASFYIADSIAGPWQKFGGTPSYTFTAAIADSVTPVATATSGVLGACEVHAVQIRSAGTLVASPVFDHRDSADVPYVTDAQGNRWLPVGQSAITDARVRFTGEVSSWPVAWRAEPDSVVTTTLDCAGIMRRLGQGSAPIASTLRRSIPSTTGLVGYWPLEDAARATNLTAVPGQAGKITAGKPSLAAADDFACSSPLPTLGDGRLMLALDPYTGSGAAQIRWLLRAADSLPADSVLLRITTGSTLGRIDVHITSAGEWYLRTYTSSGEAALVTGTQGGLLDEQMSLAVELRQVAATVETKIVQVPTGAMSGSVRTTTHGGAVTLGPILSVEVNPDGADLGDTVIGHVYVSKAITTVFDLADQSAAYAGERADTRIIRVGTEAGIPIATIGPGGGAERVGVQLPAPLLDVLQEVAAADDGILLEPRDATGLTYRPLSAMVGQQPRLTIPYGALLELEPTDDDQGTRNRVTVTRDGGAEAMVSVDSGPMSTQPPPGGVGVYDESLSLSLARDEQARHQAGWRVARGTVEEARWPTATIHLYDEYWTGSPAQTAALLSLDIGDRVDIVDLPEWLPPERIEAIVQGISETITPDAWRITLNLTPASPYRVGAWAGSVATVTQQASTLVTDDFTGTDGSALDPAIWDDAEMRTGASATRAGGAGVLNAGTLTAYDGRAGIVLDLTARADSDVTLDFERGASEAFLRLYQRADLYIDGQVSGGYALVLDPQSGTWAIKRLEAWAETDLTAEQVSTFTAGAWYRVRWVITGPRHQVKIWPATSAEPSAWSIDVVDGAPLPAGRIGVTVAGGEAAGGTMRIRRVRVDGIAAAGAQVAAVSPGAGRWSSSRTTLVEAITATATSFPIIAWSGPRWTTDPAHFPFDVIVDGEVMTATSITGTTPPQTMHVTRPAPPIGRAHPISSSVDVARPSRWIARPLGGSIWSAPGGTSTNPTEGGGTGAGSTRPTTVVIGTATYPLAGINPGASGGWGGDTSQMGGRGSDQLVIYQAPMTGSTPTNEWGVEVVVDGSGVVVSVNDRISDPAGTSATPIPAAGYVLSGHAAAGDWLRTYAQPGVQVLLTASPDSTTEGGTGDGGTGTGNTGGGTTTPSTNRSGLPFQLGVFSNTLDRTKFEAFQAMAGRPLDLYDAHADWGDLAAGWWGEPHQGRGYNVMLSCQMYGPSGVGTNNSAHWTAVATNLKNRGWPQAYVRLGVEFNLSNSWKATNGNMAQWRTRFAEASTAIRAVIPGARIIICPNEGLGSGEISTANQQLLVEQLAPYFDLIGPDYYDQWEPIYNTSQASARFGNASTFGTMNYWLAKARSLGKRFCIPEWGVASGTQWAGHQGNDNPFYMGYLLDWCAKNSPDVEMVSYFEEPDPYLRSDITTAAINPNARATFRSRIAQFAAGQLPT